MVSGGALGFALPLTYDTFSKAASSVVNDMDAAEFHRRDARLRARHVSFIGVHSCH